MNSIQDDDLFGIGRFLKQPFNAQGSALNWLAFVGLLLVILWFWQWVLIKLARGIDSVD